MIAEQAVTFEGPAGQLEGRHYEAPSSPGLAVVCHPHPQHYGNMNNKVVTTLCRAFKQAGFSYIRFNYRGVGASAGCYDEARGEIDDCLAIVKAVQAQTPAQPLWLAGFSFGSYIAYQVAQQQMCQGLVLVAPPVNHFEFSQGAPACPYWVIQGDKDEIVPLATVQTWVQAQQTPPQFQEFKDTDHFFHGRLVTLCETVEALLP